ncbi:MAG TPA: FGGY family carbohydrate kinase, partial [Actinomycetota bacterium]|nr:FGGY family carbohydrate kinase [Actinomycetota bacterium]
MDDLLLGLDLGTSRCKAVLVDGSGSEVGAATAPTPFRSAGGCTEMAVDALLATVSGLAASLEPGIRRVTSVGIAGMAECGAPLDAYGRPLAPIVAWHDPRGTDVAEHLQSVFGDALGLRTGQRPRPVSTIAKLGWLVGHGIGPVARWLGAPELCLHELTGEAATEHSLASRTGCYDVVERRWLEEVARAAGFSTAVFAPVLAAGSVMGRTRSGRGLPAGIPVTLAGHDHLAGMLGAGARPGDLVNSVGTAETVVGTSPVLPDMAKALELRVAASVAPGGASWAGMTGATRAGLVLAAAAGALGRSLAALDALAGTAAQPAG